MAGVHSPSDAFAHLQHHQHNGLLGPSMQVRGPRTSLTFFTAHCNPCQCIVAPPPPQPIPYITSLSFIRLCGQLALLGCLAYSTILACAVLHFRLSRFLLSYTLASLQSVSLTKLVQNVKKLHEKKSVPHLKHAASRLCLHLILFLCFMDV